jgi:hypothetical protein
MLQDGTDFHMHIIPTAFGSFNVPVLNHGTPENPDWRLMNGDSTKGITMHHEDSEVLNTGVGLWDGLKGFVGGIFSDIFGAIGGDGDGMSFMDYIRIAIAIFLIVLLLPVIGLAVVVLFFVFRFVIRLIKLMFRRAA